MNTGSVVAKLEPTKKKESVVKNEQIPVVKRSISSTADDENEPVMPTKLARAQLKVQGRHCPYLDTINRSVLDFDFEKLCSVTLSHLNVYACLVCGKYFQGRADHSEAYTHSVQEDHRIFLNLETHKFYCLPDSYEVVDNSLSDIIFVLNPTYTESEIESLDVHKQDQLARAYDGTLYIPGFVGLNNIKYNDYCNVILQALSHVPPIRNFFLGDMHASVKRPPGDHLILLVKRFGELICKLWNPRNFKAHVSPHEMLQAVILCSKKRFQFTEQNDPAAFLTWLLNSLHIGMNGTKNRKSTIISRTFQGSMRIVRRKIPPADLEEQERRNLLLNDPEYQAQISVSPFMCLSCDLPAAPLYPDDMKDRIIPQIPLFAVLAKFNGVSEKEVKTYKDLFYCRYELLRLPTYIILVFKRFAKNLFNIEKNPTIVNFPIKNIDFGDLLSKEARAKHKFTCYDLIANVVHDGEPEPGKGTYRCHILNKSSNKWCELQDMHIKDILPQMITLSESYIQIYELQTEVRSDSDDD